VKSFCVLSAEAVVARAPSTSDCISWDRCYEFNKYFRQKNYVYKNGAFYSKNTSFCKNLITTLVFQEKRQFIIQKLGKLAENFDHKIDP
jgi:hypothetical protein